MRTIAFDIYGTLINPMALGDTLNEIIGEKSASFNILWRDKQLEYSFRKAAMKQFNHFSECTKMALDYCDEFLKTNLTESEKNTLLSMYRKLPAYYEAEQCLRALQKKKIDLVFLSHPDSHITYFNQNDAPAPSVDT